MQRVKCIVIGDAAVGKSTLIYRLTENKFFSDYESSIGVEFAIYCTPKYRLAILDTAGTESFRAITRSYYHDVILVFLVFSFFEASTFHHLNEWYDEIIQHHPHKIIVLGNKHDLTHKVSSSVAQLWAQERNCLYYETSAKDGRNIHKAFLEATDFIRSEDLQVTVPIIDIENTQEKTSCCQTS